MRWFWLLLSRGTFAAAAMFLVGAIWEFVEAIWLGDYVTGNSAFRHNIAVLFYLYAHPVLFGYAFTAGFAVVCRKVGKTNEIRLGVCYGLFLFLLGSFPIFLMLGLALAVPLHVVPIWMMRNLSQYVAAGAILGLAWPKYEGQAVSQSPST